MNHVKQYFFLYPSISKDRFNRLLNNLDAVLNKAIKEIDNSSYYVYEHYKEYYLEIANGKAHFKDYYIGKNNNRKGKASRLRSGLAPDDRKFLREGFSLFTSTEISHIKFNRHVKMQILEDFMLAQEGYIELIESLAKEKKYDTPAQKKQEYDLKIKNDGLYSSVTRVRDLYARYTWYRNQLIWPYFKYVYAQASQKSRKPGHISENFQMGVRGILTALSHYKVNSRNKFISYAKTWVKHYIMKGVYNSYPIKIPHNTWVLFNKIDKVRSAKGIESIKDIARETNMTEKTVENVYSRVIMGQCNSSEEMIESGFTEPFMYQVEEESELDKYAKDLTSFERLILGASFGDSSIVLNNITQSDIEKERLRQSANNQNVN